MGAPVAINVRALSHFYGARQALRELSLSISQGEVFVFLGPNGGGKTTLFRVLSTLLRPQRGEVEILGLNVARHTAAIRARLGVVFQAPSLDKKLTVRENMRCQAALYGIRGSLLRQREAELLERLGLRDRAHDYAETLSGGLRRRVELAKCLLHRPDVLLLDEPSTGLDPGARNDLWQLLGELRREYAITIALTTHLLDEAEKADRIAILHEGALVALDSPERLKNAVGGDTISMETAAPLELAAAVVEKFGVAARVVDGQVRLEQPQGHAWIARLVEAFPGHIRSIKLAKPTLEDVFIAQTGHRFWEASPRENNASGSPAKQRGNSPAG